MKIRCIILALCALALQACVGPQAVAGVGGQPDFPEFSRSFIGVGDQDGWVLESSEQSATGLQLDRNGETLRVGDDSSRRQFRSIVSFDTSPLPDNAVITSVRLVLTQQAPVNGGDPFRDFRGLVIDIKLGFFGRLGLDATDFASNADVSAFGPYQPAVAETYSFALGRAAYPYVNRWGISSGQTQLRLRFRLDDADHAQANYVTFYSGDAPSDELRPRLIVNYHLGSRAALAMLP